MEHHPDLMGDRPLQETYVKFDGAPSSNAGTESGDRGLIDDKADIETFQVPYESESEDKAEAEDVAEATYLEPQAPVPDEEEWTEDEWIQEGTYLTLDPATGTVLGAESWTAVRPEPFILAYEPFMFRLDYTPTLLRVREPLTFSRSPGSSNLVATLQVTNMTRKCISFMLYPSDSQKLTIPDHLGLLHPRKSTDILVHSNLDLHYGFRDIISEHIMLFAAPVRVWDLNGRLRDPEVDWDRIRKDHLLRFWESYGTASFPKAEVQEVSDFEPECREMLLEPGLTESRIWGPLTPLGQAAAYFGTQFRTLKLNFQNGPTAEEEEIMAELERRTSFYPNADERAFIMHYENSRGRTAFEAELLGLQAQKTRLRETVEKALQLGLYLIIILGVLNDFDPTQWKWPANMIPVKPPDPPISFWNPDTWTRLFWF